MHPLDVPVKRLREGPLPVDVDLPAESFELEDPAFEFRGPVQGHVVFSFASQVVMAQGELEVTVAAPCGRCLEPAEHRVHAHVQEVWMPHRPEAEARPDDEEEDDDPIVHVYRDDLVEPAEVFRELLMLELPEPLLCREDCKGLCPGCGANLNIESCHCGPEKLEALDEMPEAPVEAPLPDWKRKLKDFKL